MVIRLAAAAALALVLGGCGGNAPPKPTTTPAEAAASAHWRAGLERWSHNMNAAVDALSIVFSSPADVRGIQAGDKQVGAKLGAIELALLACTARVTALGDAPAAFLPARAQALIACKQLEQGASLVRAGVAEIQGGRGVDLFDRASDPLGTGQDSVRRAVLELSALAG